MKSIEFLESKASSTPSKLRERAEWRRANREWLRKSQQIALNIMTHMEQQGLTQRELAQRMGVTPQYVNKILRGSENLSLDTICKLEKAMGAELVRTDTITFKSKIQVLTGFKSIPSRIDKPYMAKISINSGSDNGECCMINLTAC